MKVLSFPLHSADPARISRAMSGLFSGLTPPVFLCIGSDRITGDCLGPLTGHFLTEVRNVPAFVYGTLDRPVNAKNVTDVYSFIKNAHGGRKVVAVDAALGKAGDIGTLRLSGSGIAPAAAVRDGFPAMGDFSITVVVGEKGTIDNLTSVRLGLVFRAAALISASIEGYLRASGFVLPSIADLPVRSFGA